MGKRKPVTVASIVSIIMAIVFILTPFINTYAQERDDNTHVYERNDESLSTVYTAEQSWIIKWHDEPSPVFTNSSEIVEQMPQFNAVVTRPLDMSGQQTVRDWIAMWEQSPYVAYIQPNHQVQLAAQPNDPHYVSQTYLQQIHIEEAWEKVNSNNDIIIAIVDTGVDHTHPELRSNLVNGVNLVEENKRPQDDNGHGTSLAGIIGARTNNSSGIAGMLWRTKIMPIKALNANGTGDESKLGQGIRYAVDHGAKIVLLSLGLYKYSPFMQDIVQYAEDRGVLLVAAAGNDGKDVKYPAAYPTVLAVGGVNMNNLVVKDSNFGPELDVVAPWSVYTTLLDGEYGNNRGTSMAAPQVAAVAAMIWALDPQLEPHEIRDHIKATAETLGPQRWDPHAGFGLLRADLAVNTPIVNSLYSGHRTRATAKPLSIRTSVSSMIQNRNEANWFTLSAPYNGEITFEFTADQPHLSRMQLTYYEGSSTNGTTITDLSKPISLSVRKGMVTIQIQPRANVNVSSFKYHILTEFHIYSDAFEDNDRQYKAYVLPPDIQTIVGTFHQLNDEDWFVLPVEQSGTLRVTGTMDSNRIDLELLIFKQGEKIKLSDTTDMYGEGKTEYTRTIEVLPGKYYIRARNTISEQAYPTVGEYTLYIDYQKKYIDPNEPNDRAFQATSMVLQQAYEGVLTDDDVDWFSFRIPHNSYVTLSLSNVPVDRMMTMTLLNNSQKQLAKETNSLGERQIIGRQVLGPGNYYIQLTANQSFDYQMYRLRVDVEQLVAGYRDIQGHWAKNEIMALTEDGIVKGYDHHLFRPDHTITRAEAVRVITQAFKLTDMTERITFSDVSSNHWTYDDIAIAAAQGIINGYPDGSFRPDETTSRVEMAVMIGNALQLKGMRTGERPFTDVHTNHWASELLTTMKSDGWVTGYPDGSYKPSQSATRAEFVTFIARIIR